MNPQGQLFGLEVSALIACPDPGSPDRFQLDISQVELALSLFCVGTVYVAQLDVTKPGCSFTLTERDLKYVMGRATELSRCPVPPLFAWLPDYADKTPSIAAVLTDAEASSSFLRVPFPAAAAPASVASLSNSQTPLPFLLDDIPLSGTHLLGSYNEYLTFAFHP
jgi:hypothetical protein